MSLSIHNQPSMERAKILQLTVGIPEEPKLWQSGYSNSSNNSGPPFATLQW